MISKEIKELVIVRLETSFPPDKKISIGGIGGIAKDELIDHVRKEDEIGKIIVEAQLEFLKSLKTLHRIYE